MPASRSPEEVNCLRSVGNRVRLLRAVHSMSQAELAERVGLSRIYVGALERGTANPTLLTLRRIAEALDTTVARLTTDEA